MGRSTSDDSRGNRAGGFGVSRTRGTNAQEHGARGRFPVGREQVHRVDRCCWQQCRRRSARDVDAPRRRDCCARATPCNFRRTRGGGPFEVRPAVRLREDRGGAGTRTRQLAGTLESESRPRVGLLLRHQHRVDDVNHAVAARRCRRSSRVALSIITLPSMRRDLHACRR